MYYINYYLHICIYIYPLYPQDPTPCMTIMYGFMKMGVWKVEANLRWLVELVVLFSPILPIVKANLGVNWYTPLLVMYPNVSPWRSIMVDYKSVFSLVNPMKSPCSREDLAGPGKGAMGTMGAMEIWAAKAQWHHDGQLI